MHVRWQGNLCCLKIVPIENKMTGKSILSENSSYRRVNARTMAGKSVLSENSAYRK